MQFSWFRRFLMSLMVLAFLCSPLYAVSTTVVISQVYSAQLSGSRLRRDFIELFNVGTTSVSLAGWSLQIATVDNSTWTVIPLSGSIAPGQYFLIGGRTTAIGMDLPQTNMSTTAGIEATGGRVALASDTSAFNGITCPTSQSSLVDFIPYGNPSGCNDSPGEFGLENNSLSRKFGGCSESDSNGNDFRLSGPFPRNTSSPRNPCSGTIATASRSYSIPASGGASMTTDGSASSLTIGSARIQNTGGGTPPSGLAIFGYRQGGNLVSEASVPAAPLMRSALIFVEVNSPINTGIAITNPTDSDITVNFNFNDANRGYYYPTDFGTITIPANGQVASFLSELPFSLSGTRIGTIELNASDLVGVIALRGYTNERSEFLVTTLPVLDLTTAGTTDPSFLAHLAVDGGWKTEIALLNPNNDTTTGTIEFRDTSGAPALFLVGGLQQSSVAYTIPAKNAFVLNLPGVATGNPRTASVRVTVSSSGSTPLPLAVFSYRKNNITVAEAGLQGTRGSRFRTYVEASGVSGTNGSIQSGLAITNATASPVTVTLDLFRLDGTSTGLTSNITLQPNAQIARFLNELFPSLSGSIQGVLRISTTGQIGIVGLRTRYNERNDFLFTTVPASDEAAPLSTIGSVFPHFADSGGYTTQFILYGATGSASSGNLFPLTPGGVPLVLTFR